jgi:hypothetical protein
MPYVKISDPNIIDLGAWQQVINVVNQHSDSINSITNNFGVQGSGTIEWNGDNDVVNEYNPGPQKILYGRTKIVTAEGGAASIQNDQIFHGEINFVDEVTGTSVFSGRPIVTGTIQFGHQTIEALEDKSHNIVFNIFGVNSEKFNFRVTRATSTEQSPIPLTGSFYLSWQAIGPK